MAADYAKVRAILDAATPGPWMHDTGPGTWNGGDIVTVARNAAGVYPLGYVSTSGPDGDVGEADARAIVVTRNLAPELLAVAEAAAGYITSEVGSPLQVLYRVDLRDALDALDAEVEKL